MAKAASVPDVPPVVFVEVDAGPLFTMFSTPSAASDQSTDHAPCSTSSAPATRTSPGAARSAAVASSTCAAAKAMRRRTHQ